MEIINIETAKLAKEVGFDWECRVYFESSSFFRIQNKSHNWNQYKSDNWNQYNLYSAPEQSYLQKWLRDEHDIHVEVNAHGPHSDYNTGSVRYSCNITYRNELKAIVSLAPIPDKLFALKTYEEALEKGLQKGLEILKNAINKNNN